MLTQNGLSSFVGSTPLLRLKSMESPGSAQIWAKLEFMNPGGSCKDRLCLGILESMEATEGLTAGDSLVEASGGNTAVSLAMMCAARKYSLTLVMPDTVPNERKRFLAAYGATVIVTPPANGMRGAISKALEIAGSRKRTFMINQFENPANPEVHRRTTAPEILRAIGRAPDVFVSGVGTGGTITGVGEVFKKEDQRARVVAVEPAESAILSGGNPGPHRIPGIGAGFIPRVLNTDIIDDVIVVTYPDAMKIVKHLAEKEGIFAGLSSGAALFGAVRNAERLDPTKIVVTVLCDSGERYLAAAP
ncbi:cysteine synthase A [Desulfomonile tiedjei]|uniref:cysteine synthase n=1 Tax=Desulfomonile tiedjei (strain ATCC 49306 / DSM 6799 / DCB-1) TaxID=706587 RepID=I4CAR9_DESTA|nr:cysteine synthase A [Desulfomonile tiedjei]AFM26660.1 cysteine synthase [Desulfomonile tiedjei DSM 6799]